MLDIFPIVQFCKKYVVCFRMLKLAHHLIDENIL